MDITLTLSDAEVEAIESERTTPSETLSDIIHRQFIPLVDRLLSQKLRDLQVFYNGLPIDQKIASIAELEALAAARKTAIASTPKP